ncbi:helix-turn-helix domain-containing protein [Nonomuraea roseola]|uniref:Helix-turn-helix domain-containing protein n=1 Tax=Nonomuraea roseola TaxID=46179 RepID=A0ABV5PPS0_9ACTN
MSAIDGDLREVGARLRRMREERGLSLSELARRAGVGKATLSGVETGVRNPTLDTLWAITAQLGVPIAAVLGTPTESVVMRGEAVVATLLEVFEDDGVTYELYRMRVPPGGTQTSPAHHEGVTEHITVFTGTLSAGPLDSPQVAGPGGYLTWRSDVPHGYAAVGAEEVLASLLIRYPATR